MSINWPETDKVAKKVIVDDGMSSYICHPLKEGFWWCGKCLSRLVKPEVGESCRLCGAVVRSVE